MKYVKSFFPIVNLISIIFWQEEKDKRKWCVMKIAICGLVKSDNLGEQFISKSLSWIIQDEYQKQGYDNKIQFVEVDIQATNDVVHEYQNVIQSRKNNLYDYTYRGIPADVLHFGLKLIAAKSKSLKVKNVIYKIRHIIWRHSLNLGKRYRKYFISKFKDVDLIIIDGAGLLEYSYNAYQEPLALISEYANNHNISVVYNAIGRAGDFDKNDYRCQVLMSAFRHRCVKYVSARDSRDTVQACVGARLNVKLLADAAFCIDESFQIKANPIKHKIGIGLIRGDASLSYAEGFNESDWINLFADIAQVLESKGYQYEFFTNGMRADYETGQKVIDKLGGKKDKLVDRPTDARSLLNTISSYEGIISCRMHSSIAAFSLGIPSVVLSWNNKVDKYMKIVGYPDRAIPQKDFKASIIVEMMKKAISEGISDENRLRLKKLARESVKDYMPIIVQSATDEQNN